MYSSEKEWIVASLLNHNENSLTLDTLKDVFHIKSSNSSFKTKAGRLQFLSQVREQLKKIPCNSMELQRINSFIKEQSKALDSTKNITVNSNYVSTTHSIDDCPHCEECSSLPGKSIKTSMFQPDKILKKLTPIIQAFDDISLSDSLKNYDKLACPNAKRIRAAKIIHDIIDLCSEDIFQFDNRKMFVFKHTFRSNDCTMSIKDNCIQFLSARMLTLEPADIIHLDFVLHTRTAILHEVIQNDKLPIVAAPNILSDIVLSILGLPVFNASNNKLTVQPGTLLFSLAFTKVHSILAIHDDEPKIVRKTLQEKNILNSVLLQTLSSLMSRLATTLDMEERIQTAEALHGISVQTSESENN